MKIVIIGAGPAGVSAVEALREIEDFSSGILHSKGYPPDLQGIEVNNKIGNLDITMLSSEPYPPYSPPGMLHYFLTGEEAHLWRWGGLPDRLGIEYKQGMRVTSIDSKKQIVMVENGLMIEYDRLLIASGGHLHVPVPGFDKKGIFNFKSLNSANKLYSMIKSGNVYKVLIIGAGFIGIEIALLLSGLGIKVCLLEKEGQVMSGMLDKEIADMARSLIEEHGIDVQLNNKVSGFVGSVEAKAVEFESGEILNADILIAATGTRPNIDFLEDSGINTDYGIIVDKFLSTNVPAIYAAGDVVETQDRITQARSVYAIFPNAVSQGRIAAYNLLGLKIPYEGADKMNSLKHLGLPVIAAGSRDGEELRLRRKGGIMKKIFIKHDRIIGFQLIGDIKGAGIYRMLMNKRIDIGSFKNDLFDPRFGMGYIIKGEENGGFFRNSLW